MILRNEHLRHNPAVFRSVTGLLVAEFDTVVEDIAPLLQKQLRLRLERPERQRAIGGGTPFSLSLRDQILLTIVWLRIYPTNELLGYLLGVSDSTVSRIVSRVVPLLETTGQATMRMPDPGRKHRHTLDTLLAEMPELVVIVDSFEQRVQRPQDMADAKRYYSGKKKQHTLKSQVAVNAHTGQIVAVSDSVPGPTADLTVLRDSHLCATLPPGVGVIGDLAYIGIVAEHPEGLAGTPRRKPRKKERSVEDIAYNKDFASKRIKVEHTLGRMRRFQSISQMDRHHRQNHTPRVQAVAGLVNRQMRRHVRYAA